MENLKQKIGNALREKGIPANKLCQEVGITEATLYRIYRLNTGNYTTLGKIKDYLGININETIIIDSDSKYESLGVVEYLKKENQFLRSFIYEKLGVNFNLGLLRPTFDIFLR